MKNERTSARVAKIARRILAADIPASRAWFTAWKSNTSAIGSYKRMRIKWSDIRALAASVLNQAEDHSDRATLKAGKRPKGHKLIKRFPPITRRNGASKRAKA